MKELRRGIETNEIWGIDFNYCDSMLVCVSGTKTIHVWKLSS